MTKKSILLRDGIFGVLVFRLETPWLNENVSSRVNYRYIAVGRNQESCKINPICSASGYMLSQH